MTRQGHFHLDEAPPDERHEDRGTQLDVEDMGPTLGQRLGRALYDVKAAAQGALGAPVDPPPPDPSPRQRLRIHVPDVRTTLSMGTQALKGQTSDTDGGPPSFDGFGVTTAGHVYVGAEQTATVHAKQWTEIRSPAVCIGGDSHVIHGEKVVVVNGGRSVVIGAGAWKRQLDYPAPDGVLPPGPEWAKGARDIAIAGANTWAVVDMYAGALEAGLGMIYNIADVYHASSIGERLFAAGKGLWEGWVGFTQDAGVQDMANGAAPDKLEDSVVVYAGNNLVLASDGSAGLYGNFGATLASPTYAGVTGGLGVSLTSLTEVGITAVKGPVSALGKRIELVAARENVEIASRKAAVELRGECITIGGEAASHQSETETASVYARTWVGLEGKFVSTRSAETAIWATQAIDIRSRQALSIYGKNITVTGGEILDMAAAGKATMSCGGSLVELTKTMAVLGVDAPTPARPPFEMKTRQPGQSRAEYSQAVRDGIKEHDAELERHAEMVKNPATQARLKKDSLELRVQGQVIRGDKAGWTISKVLRVMG